MRGRWVRKLLKAETAAVAPMVGLSLFALIGVGGIAFDYARLAGMNSELQTAADQAALAAAAQLDQKPNAITRARNAARLLITNKTLFANDKTGQTNGQNVDVPTARIIFYTSYDSSNDTFGPQATTDATAKFVQVEVEDRVAKYALTPVVQVLKSGNISALALAGVGEAICKVPPVMLCNPNEPNGNTDEDYPVNLVEGQGLKLITGNATVPGNFGWLESNIGNGASALAAALGYNDPIGDCSPETGVTTKTGMDTSVLSAFNTRFDVFDNGNQTCPSQYSGTCSPSRNARKDLVCGSNNGTSCKNDNWSFDTGTYAKGNISYQGYVNPSTNQAGALPTDGSKDPIVMSYPMDLCHSVPSKTTCGIAGDGNWDRDAYFRVNYGWTTQSAWTGATTLSANVTRYKVYSWELTHPSVTGGGGSARGIDVPQPDGANTYAFGYPATGRPGVTPGGNTTDRRRISVAVLNCRAANVKGKTSGIDVPKWIDVFLVQPAIQRGNGGSQYTDGKEVYVEVIGETTSGNNGSTNSQVVQRSVPYLIR